MDSRQAKGGKRDSSDEGLELNRDLLSVLAHELGGIAGALDLRAEVLAKVIPAQDLAALRALANEVRGATRTARLVRGDVPGTLSPTRRQTLAEWWEFTSRFTRVVLPREALVDAQVGDSDLSGASASALTLMWLTACKDLAERGVVTACTIILRAQRGDESGALAIVAEVAAEHLSAPDDSGSRWEKYASKLARELGCSPPSWQRDGSTVRWRCMVDRT